MLRVLTTGSHDSTQEQQEEEEEEEEEEEDRLTYRSVGIPTLECALLARADALSVPILVH